MAKGSIVFLMASSSRSAFISDANKKPIFPLEIKKRLLANSISGQEKLLLIAIPYPEGEHPPQFLPDTSPQILRKDGQ